MSKLDHITIVIETLADSRAQVSVNIPTPTPGMRIDTAAHSLAIDALGWLGKQPAVAGFVYSPSTSIQLSTRYCPECGHVGKVGAGHRDCCPDGSAAFMVPEKYAQELRAGFKLMLVPPGAKDVQRIARDEGINHGVCIALQVMASAGDADSTQWNELLDAAGRSEVMHYAKNVEPENWELCGFAQVERTAAELDNDISTAIARTSATVGAAA